MSWIDDVANQARDDDDNQTRREKAYEQQIYGVWNSLISRVQLDVEEINNNADLVKRRLGGSVLRFEQPNNNSFTVSKLTIPSVYVTVTHRYRYFEVARQGE